MSAGLARAAGVARRAAVATLAAFAFYTFALELGASRGLVAAVASPVGLALLVGSGLLLLVGAAGAAAGDGGALRRAARALVLAGGGLALVGIPASLLLRDARMVTVVEGESLGPRDLPGLDELDVPEITLAPRGPHLLSKTVSVMARRGAAAPLHLELFPPERVGAWRLSVFKFGFAPAIDWRAADGQPLGQGRILLGTIPHDEDEAGLVQWTPEANVMMGAGTFPPKLEELVRGADPASHLFLRLEAATIAGVRRDLRAPDAYRWLVDGRLEEPLFLLQVFRGREKVYEGRIAGGATVQFDGGLVSLAPDVAIFADLLATRDPWLPVAGLGLASLALGTLGSAVAALAAPLRRRRRAP